MTNSEVSRLITADPGLPHSNPTQSYWQHIPHALANVQSPSLPEAANYVVIGSGITGLAVSQTLLASQATATVTVLEARTLCSGATGRNGGQLAANVGEEYLHLSKLHGPKKAGQIAKFTLNNLQRMRELVQTYAPDESELQEVQKLRVFQTSDSFAAFKESIAAFERDHPSLRGIYTIISAEELKAKYNTDGAGGALLPAGTVWPYRLVTCAFDALLTKYKSRLSIETNTPVTSVESDPSATTYLVNTPRGSIRAHKVAYCTNGYSGHLLPRLRGSIYPFKGTMTVQDPGSSVPNRGSEISWGFHYPAVYDPVSNRFAAGLYYLLQSARTGYLYFGGEETHVEDCLSADDSKVEASSVANLCKNLPRFLGVAETAEEWKLVSAWSGVMGFSADGLPLVGHLPASLTGREGGGEYIAAAFNGYGMANCLLCGEALAKIMTGTDTPNSLPESYRLEASRLTNVLTVDNAIKHFEAGA